jgi:hypothetical protein
MSCFPCLSSLFPPSQNRMLYDALDQKAVAALKAEAPNTRTALSDLQSATDTICEKNGGLSKDRITLTERFEEKPLYWINCIRLLAIEKLGLQKEILIAAKKPSDLIKACESCSPDRVQQLLLDGAINVNTYPCYQIIYNLIHSLKGVHIYPNPSPEYTQKVKIIRLFAQAGFNLYSYVRYLKHDFTPYNPGSSWFYKTNKKELKPQELRILLDCGVSVISVEKIAMLFKDREDLKLTLFASCILHEGVTYGWMGSQKIEAIRRVTLKNLQDTILRGKASDQELTRNDPNYPTLSDEERFAIQGSYEFCLRCLSALVDHSNSGRSVPEKPISEEIWKKIYESDRERRIDKQKEEQQEYNRSQSYRSDGFRELLWAGPQ